MKKVSKNHDFCHLKMPDVNNNILQNKPGKTYYRGKDCMKRFCDDLKENVTRITNYEMKPKDLLTKEEEESYKNIKNYIKYKNIKI